MLVESLGPAGFFTSMSLAVMAGNSSSGIIERSFALPVINIGSRKRGRLRARNVIDCGESRGEIVAALRQALRPEFRASLCGLDNPYGTGTATAQMIHRLKTVPIDDKLIHKRFMKHGK